MFELSTVWMWPSARGWTAGSHKPSSLGRVCQMARLFVSWGMEASSNSAESVTSNCATTPANNSIEPTEVSRMKKIAPPILVLTVSGVCCVVAAYFCHFYYTRYQSTVTELESRVNSFDMRLATLEGHKSRELTPVHVWGIISTADRPEDEHLHFYLSSE